MQSKTYVVGKTYPHEVFVASKTKAFILDEYLIIEDGDRGNPIGEVVETYSYPIVEKDTFDTESAIYSSLESLGLMNDSGTIYIGKLKILKELQTPIKTGASIRIPKFFEVEELLMPTEPSRGFTLGVVRGTDDLQGSLPDKVRNISPLYNSDKKTILKQNGIPFILNHLKFSEYPHIGFFGGSGSGKTFGLRVLCEEIMEKSIPGIILDPHYELSFSTTMEGMEELSGRYINKHEVFQIGENIGINFAELGTEELLSLLEYVADLSQPMVGALQELHQSKDSFTTLFNRVDNLRIAFENQDKLERDRETLSEDIIMLFARHRNKIAGTATLQALSWRLDQLNKTGIFNCDISLVEACILKRKLAVIRGKQKHLKMLSSYLINKLYRKRRDFKDWEQKNENRNSNDRPQKFPPFFIIIDEAHEFADNSSKNTPIKRVLREISQEARKYGVFEVFGTQRPALLDTTITAQLNTKVIFRTGIDSDMQMIKTETNLNSAQVKRLPELESGNAFISSATLRKTMYIRFRATSTSSPHSKHPFEELDMFNTDSKLKEILIKFMPIQTDKLHEIHSDINNEIGKALSKNEIEEVLGEMVLEGLINKKASPFGDRYSIR